MKYKKPSKTLLAVAVLLASASVAMSGIIYQDDFSGGSGTSLYGATTDVGGGVWTNNGGSSATFNANGTIVTNAAGTNSGLWLPVMITQGNIYTAEVDVDVTSGGWLTFGFAETPKEAAFYTAGAYGTHLMYGTGTFPKTGRNNTGNLATKTGYNGNVFHRFGIKLDATDTDSANWTFEFFFDGTSFTEASTLAEATGGAGDFENIQYVGFTTGGSLVTATIDNFELTEAIPEPATLGLIAVSGVGLLLFRRRVRAR